MADIPPNAPEPPNAEDVRCPMDMSRDLFDAIYRPYRQAYIKYANAVRRAAKPITIEKNKAAMDAEKVRLQQHINAFNTATPALRDLISNGNLSVAEVKDLVKNLATKQNAQNEAMMSMLKAIYTKTCSNAADASSDTMPADEPVGLDIVMAAECMCIVCMGELDMAAVVELPCCKTTSNCDEQLHPECAYRLALREGAVRCPRCQSAAANASWIKGSTRWLPDIQGRTIIVPLESYGSGIHHNRHLHYEVACLVDANNAAFVNLDLGFGCELIKVPRHNLSVKGDDIDLFVQRTMDGKWPQRDCAVEMTFNTVGHKVWYTFQRFGRSLDTMLSVAYFQREDTWEKNHTFDIQVPLRDIATFKMTYSPSDDDLMESVYNVNPGDLTFIKLLGQPWQSMTFCKIEAGDVGPVITVFQVYEFQIPLGQVQRIEPARGRAIQNDDLVIL